MVAQIIAIVKWRTTPKAADRHPDANDVALPRTPAATDWGMRMGAFGLYTTIAYVRSITPATRPPTRIAARGCGLLGPASGRPVGSSDRVLVSNPEKSLPPPEPVIRLAEDERPESMG